MWKDEEKIFTDHTSILHRLEKLYGDDELSDVTLTVGYHDYAVHKLILGSASPVLKVMLLKSRWPESINPRIQLNEDPQCCNVFGEFLKYIYMGTVHLTTWKVLSLLMLADKYQLNDLVEICVKYMVDHVYPASQNGILLSWLHYGIACHHPYLMHECRTYIACNFSRVIQMKDFISMEPDMLVSFLRDSSLVVESEEELLAGVVKWLNHQITKFTPADLLYQVLCCVRFTMIEHIARESLVIQSRELQTVLEMCLLNKSRSASSTYCSEIITMEPSHPRNYTNDSWAALLTIDNYLSLPKYHVRPIFFSTPATATLTFDSDPDDVTQHGTEWSADLYAKGVHFDRCKLIGLFDQSQEIPGTTYEKVRLSIRCFSPLVHRVVITVLLTTSFDGNEYYRGKVEQRYIFDDESRICHMDNILPYCDLNCPDSPYLTGDNGNTFKIVIIIKPY